MQFQAGEVGNVYLSAGNTVIRVERAHGKDLLTAPAARSWPMTDVARLQRSMTRLTVELAHLEQRLKSEHRRTERRELLRQREVIERLLASETAEWTRAIEAKSHNAPWAPVDAVKAMLGGEAE
jgi:hypothetical protein